MVNEESERLGVKVMQEALRQPIRNVIENKIGLSSGSILQKIDDEGSFYCGFNVAKGKSRIILILQSKFAIWWRMESLIASQSLRRYSKTQCH